MSETRIVYAVFVCVGVVLFSGACTSQPASPAVDDATPPAAATADASGTEPPPVEPPPAVAPDTTTKPNVATNSDPAFPESADPSDPPAGPVSTAGIALSEVMPPTSGLRLEYRLLRDGVPAAETVALVVQPSRDAWANLAVHGSRVDSGGPAYVIMNQDETTWYPAAGGSAPMLAAVPWPRFFPPPGETYRFATDGIDARVNPGDTERSWSVAYQISAAYEYGPPGAVQFEFASTVVQPSERPTVAPTLVSYQDPGGSALRYELISAVVYRARMITGVVVSTGGSPQRDFAVAPHPAVGRLPEQHRSITGPNGLFTLAYRGAPGDPIRLFFGPVAGHGPDARITDPREITGRIDSPDFATLIYNQQ